MSTARHDLSAACPEQWFAQLVASNADYSKLADAIGTEVLGIAIVSGVQITGLAIDPEFPEQSVVQFSVGGDGTTHTLAVAEFARRVGDSLIGRGVPGEVPPDAPSDEALQKAIGIRNVLLAPIFGLSLVELCVEADQSMFIVVESDNGRDTVSLEALRDHLDSLVAQATGSDGRSAAIDLALVRDARAANANQDWLTTASLIGPWMSSVLVMVRTGQAQSLEPDVRDEITHALILVATAYKELDEHDMADEALRLGVQWADQTDLAVEVFLLLGLVSAERQAWGEAIGPLRRSLHLGADPQLVLPSLAQCFVHRGQMVAARACLARAAAAGVSERALAPTLAQIDDRVTTRWDTLVAFTEG